MMVMEIPHYDATLEFSEQRHMHVRRDKRILWFIVSSHRFIAVPQYFSGSGYNSSKPAAFPHRTSFKPFSSSETVSFELVVELLVKC